MTDKILHGAFLVLGFSLWLQNFALMKIVRRLDQQNRDLRKRLVTLENFTLGVSTEGDVWKE